MEATVSENKLHVHTRDGGGDNVLIFVINIGCVMLKIINIIYAAFVIPLSETMVMFCFSPYVLCRYMLMLFVHCSLHLAILDWSKWTEISFKKKE